MVMSYYGDPQSQFGYFNPRQPQHGEGGAFRREEHFDPERRRAETISPPQEQDEFPVPTVWGMKCICILCSRCK